MVVTDFLSELMWLITTFIEDSFSLWDEIDTTQLQTTRLLAMSYTASFERKAMIVLIEGGHMILPQEGQTYALWIADHAVLSANKNEAIVYAVELLLGTFIVFWGPFHSLW